MTNYTEDNRYTCEVFPENWDDEDIAFLAEFVGSEFDAKLVALPGDQSYDFALFREGRGGGNVIHPVDPLTPDLPDPIPGGDDTDVQ